MATRSFVNKNEVSEFEAFFSQSLEQLQQHGHSWSWLMQRLSFHLEHHLIQKLQIIPGRDKVQIISLGSWSRSELCPKSDIDVILLGNEDSVFSFVSLTEKQGVFLKYRTPEDKKDWTVGVKDFDLLALTKARSIDDEAKSELEQQKVKLQESAKNENLAKHWVDIMYAERIARNERYDSLANYLEPNLKFGPGGLRDAEQTSVAIRLHLSLIHI